MVLVIVKIEKVEDANHNRSAFLRFTTNLSLYAHNIFNPNHALGFVVRVAKAKEDKYSRKNLDRKLSHPLRLPKPWAKVNKVRTKFEQVLVFKDVSARNKIFNACFGFNQYY